MVPPMWKLDRRGCVSSIVDCCNIKQSVSTVLARAERAKRNTGSFSRRRMSGAPKLGE